MKAVAVYTGSAMGNRTEYLDAARAMGRAVAERGLDLVYGGASIGLMGAVADAALAAGGRVYGVLPEALSRHEIAHRGITELTIASSLHERKALMAARADAFVALPGGFGTLDELFEALTWTQVGIHEKPCGLLNVSGFYDGLLTFLDHAAAEHLVRPALRPLLISETDVGRLLDQLAAFRLPDAVRALTGKAKT